jgi:hypothetical protein
MLTLKAQSTYFSFLFGKNLLYGGMQKMSLSFKVDPRLKKALEDLAKKENRSLSNYVTTLLMKHLEDHGIDWREKKEKTKK